MSQANDPFEQEADRVADRVLRMAAPRAEHAGGCADCASEGPTCAKCAAKQRPLVQRRVRDNHGPAGAGVPDGLLSGLGAGHPLDASARSFFEPRFGRDFGDVRVHADARAEVAARALNARAFTLGPNVVFAAGEYDSRSARGRNLLAHELSHVVQQSEGGTRIQRSLSVNPTPPTDTQDPLSTLGAAAFQTLAFSEMDAVVHSLCDAFNVDAAGDVVPTPGDFCDNLGAVAAGTKPIGCCCLCALTASGSGAWTLNVTGIGGPRTVPGSTGGGDFFLHPRTSNIEFGAWNVAGARGVEDPVVVAGHELCGHGALLERGIHPANVERVDTDVHDPTVRVENLIHAEQGLPGADRGLAADPHRGESFARITVRKFPFNVSSVARLPSSERSKIQLAKDFINANNTWVDLFGHSDLVGSAGAKLAVSQARADAMQAALTSGTRPVPATISKTFVGTGGAGTGTITVSGNRFTKVEGRSDFDAIPGALDEDLRRVDIVMPTRPAGAEIPNPGTPTAIDPVGPQSLSTFVARRFFGNACDRRLARAAWF